MRKNGDDKLSFSIADYNFLYVFEKNIVLSEDMPIINFMTPQKSAKEYDIINYIEIVNDFDFFWNTIKFDLKVEFINLAWTLFKNRLGEKIILFHPGQEYTRNTKFLGCLFIKENNLVHTFVRKENYYPHVLPLCITGYLLQEVMKPNLSIMMHGAVLEINNKGVVFSGNSGVGKSTLSRIIEENIDCRRISDDRFILKKFNNRFWALGNMFDIKCHNCNNESTTIDYLLFLEHSNDGKNHLCKYEICPLEKIIKICHLPYWDTDVMYSYMKEIIEFRNRIDSYKVVFKPDSEIVGEILSMIN